MDRRETYTTQLPDGNYVTTVRTKEKYKEEDFLCLVVICLIVSVYGPGPFKGILFGQTVLLIVAGICMCLSCIFLLVYFLRLHESHLDFWNWPLSDRLFSACSAFLFLVLCLLEGYYSTGSWANNCNDIGSDGILHNGCRLIWEWAFAAFLCFILACLYAGSAALAHRNRRNLRPDTYA